MRGSRADFEIDLRRFVAPAPPPRGIRRVLKILAEPGLTFVWLLRVQLRLEEKKRAGAARVIHLLNLRTTGGEVGHGCAVGAGLVAKHPLGIVIGGGTVLGDNCTVLHNVTFGEKRPGDPADAGIYPRLGSNVVVGNGAVILGEVTVGDGAVIGAGAVVVRDVTAGATVGGVPASTLRNAGPRVV